MMIKLLTKLQMGGKIKCGFAERLRTMLPKGVRVRKVRASQGRVADNISRR